MFEPAKSMLRWLGRGGGLVVASTLGLGLAACGTTSNGTDVQRADGAVAPPVVTSDAGASSLIVAKQTIVNLQAAPLSRDRVEAELGVTLQAVPDQPFPIYKGTIAGDGPFSEVEFREASAVYLLILTVRPGVALALKDFLGDVIPAGTPGALGPTDAPAESIETYRVQNAAREAAFGFSTTSDTLLSVTFKQNR